MPRQSIERGTAFLLAVVLLVWAPAALAGESSDDGETAEAAETDSEGDEPADADQDGIPDKHDECPAMAEDGDGFRDDDGCPEEDDWTVRSMEWTVGAGTVVATAGLGLLIAGTVVRMRVRSQIQQGSSGEDATGRTLVDQGAITQREAYRRVNLGDDLRLAGALGFGLGTGIVAVTKLVAVLDDRKLFTAGDRWRLVPRVGRAHVGFSVEFGLGGE